MARQVFLTVSRGIAAQKYYDCSRDENLDVVALSVMSSPMSRRTVKTERRTMSNMSYCRFRNTLPDLRDCEEYILDEDLEPEERGAREQLVEVCRNIVREYELGQALQGEDETE